MIGEIEKDNAIVVSIPFDRIDLGISPQVCTQVDTQVTTQGNHSYVVLNETQSKNIKYCNSPKSLQEISKMLGLKERKSVYRHLRTLVLQGQIAMKNPDKPNSSIQKYVTIR